MAMWLTYKKSQEERWGRKGFPEASGVLRMYMCDSQFNDEQPKLPDLIE
jgi:hypothetical protein